MHENNDTEMIGQLIEEAVNSVISSSDAAERLKVFCAYIEMMVLNMLTKKNIDAYEELDSVYADLYGSPEEIISSLTELCRATIKLMREHTPEADSIFARTEKYLREHYTEEIMIKDMAKQMYISPVYLGSLFSKNAGVSMSTYIHSLRMEKVVEEIFAEGRQMKDIIYDVGYNNYNNFFRWFHKFFGCSPEEFKKSMYLI